MSYVKMVGKMLFGMIVGISLASLLTNIIILVNPEPTFKFVKVKGILMDQNLFTAWEAYEAAKGNIFKSLEFIGFLFGPRLFDFLFKDVL